jgi:hypothetical protein
MLMMLFVLMLGSVGVPPRLVSTNIVNAAQNSSVRRTREKLGELNG